MRVAVLIAIAALASGCASVNNPRVAGQPRDIDDAVATPLYDINVLQTKIPPVLLAARDRPYVLPLPVNCDTIASAIAPLDEVLGTDLDLPPGSDGPGLIGRGGELAVGAVEGAAEGLIPLRSWVRRLSGAERHDRLVREAIIAGGVRRAFLKGLGQQEGCEPPFAPSLPALSGEIMDPNEPLIRGPQYPIR